MEGECTWLLEDTRDGWGTHMMVETHTWWLEDACDRRMHVMIGTHT